MAAVVAAAVAVTAVAADDRRNGTVAAVAAVHRNGGSRHAQADLAVKGTENGRLAILSRRQPSSRWLAWPTLSNWDLGCVTDVKHVPSECRKTF